MIQVLVMMTMFMNSAVILTPEFGEFKRDKFYYGVENPITIKFNGAQPEDISVKVSEGNVYKRNDSMYVFTTHPIESKEVKIKLYFKKILVDQQVFELAGLPDPSNKVVFRSETNGQVKLSSVNAESGLELIYTDPNYPTDLKQIIKQYNVTIFKKGATNQSVSFVTNIGEKLTEANLKSIQSLKSGDKVVFDNILAISKTNQYSKVNNISILLID